MKNRNLICINCPRGCELFITIDDNQEITVTGNFCKRGETYAKTECTHPTRTLTTTMMSNDLTPYPVKTDKPIPKEDLFRAMDIINKTKLPDQFNAGDVLIHNILGLDANVIACKSK